MSVLFLTKLLFRKQFDSEDSPTYFVPYMMNHPLAPPKYRADIDGLRAIAVLAVVAYHAFPTWVRGGFIGVDIFFVISGFLISTIIMENLDRGSFTLLEFYKRRIRRIFPALLLVLVACLLLGWNILFAEEFRKLGKHVAGGAGFVSNLFFWKENSYFESAAETKPLLHLWSLGIEEQFYMVWPLLLWAAWKRRVNFFSLILVVASISFGLNVLLIQKSATLAFYAPHTRFWELLIGSVLAYLLLYKKSTLQRLKIGNGALLSILGLFLISVGLFFITNESAFPGWWALLPTLGAAFIISSDPKAWVNRLLANRFLVWIGLVSFPLYLWHWPILSYARILAGEAPLLPVRVVAVLVSFLLATLTYKIIETPIRHSSNRKVVFGLASAMSFVFLLGAFTFVKNGFTGRSVNSAFRAANTRTFNLSRQSDQSCLEKLNLASVSEEVCLTNTTRPTVLFVGDSHAMALYQSIYAGTSKFAQSLLVAGHGCPLYPNLDYTPTYKNPWANNCGGIAREALRIAGTMPSIETVIIAHHIPKLGLNRPSHFTKNGVSLNEESAFLEGNGQLISELQRLGKRVFYMISIPILKYDPQDCERRVSFVSPKDCSIKQLEFASERAVYMKNVNTLKHQFPQLTVFDTTSLFCKNESCNIKDNGESLYQDSSHISLYGSQKVLDLFSKANPSLLN